jgi:hydrogenase expression/formation protein HypC
MTPGTPSCPDGTCLTCSDQAVAATVLRLLPDAMALVAAAAEVAPGAGAGAEVGLGAGDAGAELVSVALVGAAVGDVILVHAGEAIAVVAG